MFYLIKNSDGEIEIIEAECKSCIRWTRFGGGYSYDYYGINQDNGRLFETKDIIHKAKTKKFLQKKYAEDLI